SRMAEAACLNRADDPCSDSAAAGIQGPTTALDLLRANGYVIFDCLLSDNAVDRLCAELDPWFAAAPQCQGDFCGWNTTRLGSVLLKSSSSHDLALQPLMLSIMDAVLGRHCDWYQLNITQAVRLHPGQQVPHRDEEMRHCQKSGIEYIVNVMWVPSDYTAENDA